MTLRKFLEISYNGKFFIQILNFDDGRIDLKKNTNYNYKCDLILERKKIYSRFRLSFFESIIESERSTTFLKVHVKNYFSCQF
ncbi:hypothetical protein BpHYR1_024717 [Brachionus plicatilis]|uniref:Uncharacterized protein n=1 Tax=Brachionus plicatilis TaxID=10195 RepID=A0A3M7SPB6_BRAPC|nr:hypothetical protein BpHYR1_024717 [Brachionus plicatilis]